MVPAYLHLSRHSPHVRASFIPSGQGHDSIPLWCFTRVDWVHNCAGIVSFEGHIMKRALGYFLTRKNGWEYWILPDLVFFTRDLFPGITGYIFRGHSSGVIGKHSPRMFSRGSFAGQSWGASLRGRLSTCMTSCIAVYLFSIPAAFVLKMICFGFAAHTEEYVQNSYLNYWKSYHIIM